MSRSNPRRWREMTADELELVQLWVGLRDATRAIAAQEQTAAADLERREARELPIRVARLSLERRAARGRA